MKRTSWLIIVSLLLLLLSACAADATPVPDAEEAEEAAPAEAVEEAAEVEEAAGSEAETDTETAAEVEEAAPAEGAVQAEAAQSGDDQPTDEQVEAALVPEEATLSEAARQAADDQLYGLVAGNIKDGGFNQLAWEGLQRAADEFGVQVQHVQTEEGGDYVGNISQLLDAGATAIVTVGQELTEATRQVSEANPDIPFVSVDIPSQTTSDLGLLFSTDEPAFMAGYLAAGMSQSGTVCTYGGRPIPPVLIFMVGFEAGIDYHNQQKGTDVQLLGWETDLSETLGGSGLFLDSFSDQEAGRSAAEELFDQGCDIIFPVAGGAGIPAAEVAQARGLTVIGVDADQTRTEPDLADVYLTSVLKRVDVAVFEAVRQINEGGFFGLDNARSNFIGTLTNGGVDLAPFHSYEDVVPPALQDELVAIRQQLLDGELSTTWPLTPPEELGAAQVTETEVITFLPVEIPTDSQAGSCFTSALGLGREDAYRCMVENNIYDPCFVVDDEPTVVCNADPTTGDSGFVLELTEPLPEPDLGNLAQPWLIELADGTICGLLQGTRPGNDEIIGAYGCTDQTYLGEELQEGNVWQAEQVQFDLGDDGFMVTASETVSLRRVWR